MQPAPGSHGAADLSPPLMGRADSTSSHHTLRFGWVLGQLFRSEKKSRYFPLYTEARLGPQTLYRCQCMGFTKIQDPDRGPRRNLRNSLRTYAYTTERFSHAKRPPTPAKPHDTAGATALRVRVRSPEGHVRSPGSTRGVVSATSTSAARCRRALHKHRDCDTTHFWPSSLDSRATRRPRQ